jgi:hypothetical protein
LRWAIIEANNSSVPGTIAFSSLFDTRQTIFLTQVQLTLDGAATTTIAGPGATLLTINAGEASRVFGVPATVANTIVAGQANGGDTGGGAFEGSNNLIGVDPLTVGASANNPVEPVDGGIIRFDAPRTGASATLSAGTAMIAGGQARVTAKAR